MAGGRGHGTVFNRGTKDTPNWYVAYRQNGRRLHMEFIEACWAEAAPKHVGGRDALLRKKGEVVTELKPKMTWYQATRHSFVSRHLSRRARHALLDEVSAAVGHSSPIVTKRFYDDYLRRSFSPRLGAGLALAAKRVGNVVPIRKAARSLGA